jgi:hypothetical protein
MENISFLLGSGFSKPAGYPLLSEMNERLGNIKADQILVDGAMTAFFLKGENDPNAKWMGLDQRLFAQEFVSFYKNKILPDSESFNYEMFYDFLRELSDSKEFSTELKHFFQEFKRRRKTRTSEHDLLLHFDLIFMQLIEGQLWKDFEVASVSKSCNPKYREFLTLIEELIEGYRIHFHSLNHDLYFEHLGRSDQLPIVPDDGFDELGSSYYGQVTHEFEQYHVRLPRFTNKYESQICLYKLHGSIDNYWFRWGRFTETIKSKRGLDTQILKEENVDGKLAYIGDGLYYHPDILAGTTQKIERYTHGNYYPAVFKHFESNLKYSIALIIIGYGFGDEGINELLDKNILNRESIPVFVVDVKSPPEYFMKYENICFVAGGVSNFDRKQILSKLAN